MPNPSINDFIAKEAEMPSIDNVINNDSIAVEEKIMFLQDLIERLKNIPTNMQAWELGDDYKSQWKDKFVNRSTNVDSAKTLPRPSNNDKSNIPTNMGAWELPEGYESPWKSRLK